MSLTELPCPDPHFTHFIFCCPCHVQMEAMTPDGMFSMDMLVRWKGRDIAVEVNGPQHYAQLDPAAAGLASASGTQAAILALRPIGYKVMRDRFLRARGFAVANVSWLEWELVAGNTAAVRTLLLQRLDDTLEGEKGAPSGRLTGSRTRSRKF